jgi:tripartite-type tricarboxylate transporter receptor subunit TctC
VQATTLPQLLDFLRKNPGRLNYGSAGNGTSHHLAGELFKLQTKTFITHIPYRGAGPALQDLIAGQVDLMFDGLGSSAAHIKSGRLRAIAVAADKRAPGFPDVPTGQGRAACRPTRWPPGTACGRPRARRAKDVATRWPPRCARR